MTRERLVEQATRTLEWARKGTAPLEPDVMRIPTSHYTDPERWRLEMDRIFRRLPLVLGFSAELPDVHSYKAVEVMGVPVLLSRGEDGQVRSFVNMCSHRGAAVAEEGRGHARRFTCPYHAWVYDTEGELVGVFQEDRFGPVDHKCHGLTALPVAERAGLIFGGLVPGMEFDVDTFLCGYGEMLEDLELGACHYVGKLHLTGSNWKLAYDGYLDFYHLPILHRRTFGGDYNNLICGDAWGPHQRHKQPDQRILDLDGVPEADWPLDTLRAGVWTIFPHVSIASFRLETGRMYQVAQLFPGSTPGSSVTVLNYLTPYVPDQEQQEEIDKMIDFLRRVVDEEDYLTVNTIEKALATGAKSEFVFGRNEGQNQRFHRWVDRLVAAETPSDTYSVLASAEQFHHTSG
jgi:phenylpropionate dioxygenase-like ring-hydroxylating dioxygenase large terminal subunit